MPTPRLPEGYRLERWGDIAHDGGKAVDMLENPTPPYPTRTMGRQLVFITLSRAIARVYNASR